MIVSLLTFAVALSVLLLAAKFFTGAAETLGTYFRLPTFVVGVFIVGIGTSLPELVSGIISVHQNASDIVPGNILGANISNLFLITGMALVLNRRTVQLTSEYITIDLHFLVGGAVSFAVVAYDGKLTWAECLIGLIIFTVYSVYLIKGGTASEPSPENPRSGFPWVAVVTLIGAGVGIYFGADHTVSALTNIANALSIPRSIVALTILSIGTTLPEIAVNIAAIKRGKAELAIGNVLGSCVFNTLMVPGITSLFGQISVPQVLIGFSLPVMVGASLLFYLLALDKRMSPWEGWLFLCLFALFMLKVVGF